MNLFNVSEADYKVITALGKGLMTFWKSPTIYSNSRKGP